MHLGGRVHPVCVRHQCQDSQWYAWKASSQQAATAEGADPHSARHAAVPSRCAARHPLSPADWHLIPSPCPGLAAALPAVLARSAAAAVLLVDHLPEAERCRLCTAALCLHRAQAEAEAALPQPLVQRILAAAMA